SARGARRAPVDFWTVPRFSRRARAFESSYGRGRRVVGIGLHRSDSTGSGLRRARCLLFVQTPRPSVGWAVGGIRRGTLRLRGDRLAHAGASVAVGVLVL